MRSLELIARMGAKGNNINGGGGGKAHSALCDSDVAGALAGVRHPLGSLLLRAKYNLESVDELRAGWRAIVIKEAAALKWGARNPMTIRLLADAVLQELVMRNDGDAEGLSHVIRAHFMLLAKSSYQEKWHCRFEHCLAMLSKIETDAVDQYAQHMKRR